MRTLVKKEIRLLLPAWIVGRLPKQPKFLGNLFGMKD
jgi:hypothetical protein